MKKRFLGKVFMMASFVAILGGFSSCKDYSEERYSDLLSKLENQNISLQEALETQKEELLKKIAELQAAQEACAKMCGEKMDQLGIKWSTDLATEVAKLNAADQALQKQIDAILAMLGDVDPSKTIPQQISDVNKVATEAAANVQTLFKKLEDVNITSQDFEKSISDLETWQTEVKALIVAWSERLTKVETDAAEALADAKANAAEIEKLRGIATNHSDSLKNIATQLGEQGTELTKQSERIDSIVNALDDFATKQELQVVLDSAIASFEAAKAYADAQIALVDSAMKDSISAVRGSIADLKVEMAKADSVLKARLDALETRVGKVEADVASNTSAINNLTNKVNKLITSIIIQGTKNPVLGSIATPFNTRSNILAAYYGKINNSEGLKFPTWNDAFFVDPSDVQMTKEDLEMLNVPESSVIKMKNGALLMAEEGNAGKIYMTINPNTVDFSGTEVTLVNSQDKFSGAKLSRPVLSDEVLRFGITRASNNGFYEASATIAPENLEDVKFSLNFGEMKEVAKDIVNGNGVNVTNIANTVVNTLSSFNMEANGLKASWTADNTEHSTYSQYGVAVAAVKPLSYSFGKDFNYTTMPGVERVDNFIGRMMDKVTNKLNNVIPDFSGMSFSAPEIKKIKIAELNPDSFKITIDIVDTVEYILDMTVPVEDVELNVEGSSDSIIITVPEKKHHIYVESVDFTGWEDIIIPAYEIKVDPLHFKIENELVHIKDVKINKVLEIPVSFTYTEDLYPLINDLYGEITGSIENVNDMLTDLDEFMDDVNDMLDELKKFQDINTDIDNAMDEIKSEITSYLDRFNDKFCNLINSSNKAVRPVLLVNSNKGITRVSQAKSNPTVITGTTLELIPTSYSMEYLAPAYKKLVGVTNVFKGSANAQSGDNDCLAALTEVNKQTNVATVLAGDTFKVSATFKPGYVYEIVYTAVDFHGMVDAKKFYVTVK